MTDRTAGKVTIGLMADPGLPSALSREMEELLPRALEKRVDDSVQWRVEVVDEVLPLNREGSIDLSRRAEQLRAEHGWDIVLYITDLPHYEEARPLVAEIALDRGAAVLCLPAMGVLNFKRLTTQTLARVVAHLRAQPVEVGPHRDPIAADPEEPDSLNQLTPISGTIARSQQEPDTVDGQRRDATVEQIYVTGLLAQVRLWAGMVLANRPWRMPLVMTTTMAAASAVGAYGVFYGSIWVLSDAAGGIRQLTVSVMAVAAMTSWLILSNGLWVRSAPGSMRRWVAMDNAATVATVAIASTLMYVGLFLLLVIGSLIIIPAEYLASELGREAGFIDFVDLAWMAANMGLLAGAVGSSFDDDDAIRDATYSGREAERRELYERQDDGDGRR